MMKINEFNLNGKMFYVLGQGASGKRPDKNIENFEMNGKQFYILGQGASRNDVVDDSNFDDLDDIESIMFSSSLKEMA